MSPPGHRAVYVTLLAETHDLMMQHMQTMSLFDPTRIPDGLYYENGFRVLEEGRALVRFLRDAAAPANEGGPHRH
jgi:circadian clock protein KaiC